jgi:hypothetical protein
MEGQLQAGGFTSLGFSHRTAKNLLTITMMHPGMLRNVPGPSQLQLMTDHFRSTDFLRHLSVSLPNRHGC